MPIYEYQCKDCGEEFERLMPISARIPLNARSAEAVM